MDINNIWFTRKARIRASERLLENDFHAQCILIYYSSLVVCVSILDLGVDDIFNGKAGVILCALSVAVLVLSSFITSINFKGRGLAFKDNYISLHALYEKVNASNTQQLSPIQTDEYFELLKNCENHLDLDDLYARVIYCKNNTSRKASSQEVINIYTYIIKKKITILALYIIPIVSLWWAW